jgi:hypothetical protein
MPTTTAAAATATFLSSAAAASSAAELTFCHLKKVIEPKKLIKLWRRAFDVQVEGAHYLQKQLE